MSDMSDLLASMLPPGLADKQEAVLAVIVIIMSMVLLLLWTRSSGGGGRGKTVVISGPCGGGKTRLFYQLVGRQVSDTVASMQENEGVCKVPHGGSVSIVDVPGHERLRRALETHLKDSRAVVFVLDSVEITPHRAEAAEELFEILTHPSVSRRRVPVLIACNKQDLEAQAHSLDFIRRTLEKQLDAMRKTRTTLSAEAKAKAAVLGKADSGKPLSLSALRNSVTVAPMSALKGDLDEVFAFLRAV